MGRTLAHLRRILLSSADQQATMIAHLQKWPAPPPPASTDSESEIVLDERPGAPMPRWRDLT